MRCVCVRACVRLCVCVGVCVGVCACVCEYAGAFVCAGVGVHVCMCLCVCVLNCVFLMCVCLLPMYLCDIRVFASSAAHMALQWYFQCCWVVSSHIHLQRNNTDPPNHPQR